MKQAGYASYASSGSLLPPLDSIPHEAFVVSRSTLGVTVEGFTAIVGNAIVAVLPSGATVLLQGLVQQQLYYIYYVDLNFTCGAIWKNQMERPLGLG
jgi:hypothetical protein